VKNHYCPAPLSVLAGFATRTTCLKLGTDALVLPFHHLVHVAEQAAMLDIMSGGRTVLGVGLGYRQSEFELFETDTTRRGLASKNRSSSSVGCGGTTKSPLMAPSTI
jgi:alkanesulfonate monooxygenase SsuD/methylene tetrahydromethanopterin reductase-like flavin-dependent oxidoreductase (luciferase family)